MRMQPWCEMPKERSLAENIDGVLDALDPNVEWNWISPRRAYALGRAVREPIESWACDARVAIVTSGGLSHFTVDEEIDRLAPEGLTTANDQILSTLPRHKLQSATTEILNWVAAAGAMGDTPMEQITYETAYRSPEGLVAAAPWAAGSLEA
jgi:hypothetical protein